MRGLVFPVVVFGLAGDADRLEGIADPGVPGREIHAFVGQFHAAVGNMVVIETQRCFPLRADPVMEISIGHGQKTDGKTEKQVGGIGFCVVHFAEAGKPQTQLYRTVQPPPGAYHRFHIRNYVDAIAQHVRVVKIDELRHDAAFGYHA